MVTPGAKMVVAYPAATDGRPRATGPDVRWIVASQRPAAEGTESAAEPEEALDGQGRGQLWGAAHPGLP